MSFGSLSDIRILDLTQMLAGPFGTMMLADHGAEVIKVESPAGDMTRSAGPFRPTDTERTHGGYFQSVNRNKKSIVLDLKTPSGQAALKALVRDTDAILENFRVGVMDRLGLSYEVLREINPRLVYGTLRGFGDPRTGASPYVNWPAFDVVAQAMGGIMGITGLDPDSPTKVGPGVGDLIPGMMLAFGTLSAIHHARRTGKGQFVDISMVDSILSVCERMVYQYTVDNKVAGPEGNSHPFICPFGLYPAQDGYVAIAAPSQTFFNLFCDLVKIEHLKFDPRFTSPALRADNQIALSKLISARTSTLTKQQLHDLIGGVIPFGPVLRMDEIYANPHFGARDMIVPVEQPGSDVPIEVAGVPIKMTETPGGVHMRGPYLGEHTDEILRRAGVSDAQLRVLESESLSSKV